VTFGGIRRLLNVNTVSGERNYFARADMIARSTHEFPGGPARIHGDDRGNSVTNAASQQNPLSNFLENSILMDLALRGI
jgi:hypothetical protein